MRVVVTRKIPQAGLDVLAAHHLDLWVNPEDRPLAREELLAAARDCDGLIAQLVDRIDAEVLAAPRLKVVANYAVGVDNIDLAAARDRGTVVTNTPDVLTEATAELAWALLLAAARRVPEGHAMTRDGKFKGWAPELLLGQGVSGKTLGVVGAGRIGAAMARMSVGFGMRVLYWSRAEKPTLERGLGARRVELAHLLRESDFVSLHVPLSESTRRLIGAAELASMKPTAVLVNTARGPVVDEGALVEALKAGRIFAAGLDVFEKEPALSPGLAELPNVVLAPHAGSATYEARRRMAELAARNVAEVLAGRRAVTPVP